MHSAGWNSVAEIDDPVIEAIAIEGLQGYRADTRKHDG